MRILVLNYEFPPLGGGAGVACESILKEFAKNPELSIDLVTSSQEKQRKEKLSDNITAHFLDIGKNNQNLLFQSQGDLLKFSFKAFFYCRKLLKQQKYDLVHAFFGVPCGFIAMQLGIPYIVSLRGSDVPYHNPRFFWLDKIFFSHLSKIIWRKAQAVIANSDALRLDAQKFLPQKEIGLINNAIDTEFFSPAAERLQQEALRLIFVGRLSEVKGISYLINAAHSIAQEIPEKKFELRIAGDGKLKDRIISLAKNGAAKERIKFLGAVEHQRIPEIIKECDCFVMPSLNEGMPMALLEAEACGMAVICSDIASLRNWVKEGVNGFLFKPASVESLVSAIKKLLSGERERIREFGRESRKVSLNMSWKTVTDKYLQVYKRAHTIHK